jgi:hypothetical protein
VPDEPRLLCEVCRKRIEVPGKAAVYLQDQHRAVAYPALVRAWEQEHDLGGGIHTMADLDSYPKPAHWRIVHDSCVDIEDATAVNYWIACDRIDTWRKAAGWTAHLMGKIWFEGTDWDKLLVGMGAYTDA